MEIEKLIERLQNWDGIKPDREIDCAIEGLKALQAENDRLKKEVQQIRWIPVEERLPEKHSEYIVCACDEGEPIDERIWGDTVVVFADYYAGGFTWYEGNTEYDISDIVTHWMPLPKAPKEEPYEK